MTLEAALNEIATRWENATPPNSRRGPGYSRSRGIAFSEDDIRLQEREFAFGDSELRSRESGIGRFRKYFLIRAFVMLKISREPILGPALVEAEQEVLTESIESNLIWPNGIDSVLVRDNEAESPTVVGGDVVLILPIEIGVWNVS